ncbi:ammonium transporter [Staphylococcus haemolyticus]|uniref:ammonium transporter n=1 Tax=Staphylococcus haemolyticus TaxID=1283 RepID=UPI000BA766C7|nr:ammonium transporter [Staphylococcus haemolyticus]MCH4431534.1 ammonium transporter [Staphylococcus haemolyticus]MCH4506474.1 ammonium transporter [Staphylococcus haemolyticus]MCK6069453.1 ammonium transporter [Staphylococcus haemolyticus]MCK6111427.1 ammonium transporter [Staphylococcus haemolyticus]MCK6168967.1 ammonium transporter [Staphylococcus haemolyticus]
MKMDDTIFLFLCTLLVWIMTPGLSLFYGGLVQSKNVLNTVMQSMAAMVIVTFTWVVLGFSLSFGTGNALIGNFDLIGLQHVGFAVNDQLSPHIPFALFMLFQMMFCTIAVSILSGSIAERMKFFPFIIFIFLWVILIYSPVAHWVWGGGWIQQLAALDYAGGTVVHITSGLSGLILAIMIGNGKKIEKIKPHNLLITLIGGILVWIGWYGFNTGSAYTLNDVALTSFVNTIIAASGGAFSWLVVEYCITKKLSLLGLLSGVLAGLVAITPAAGYVSYFSAFIISFAGGIVCYLVINVIKVKYKYNDTLDAFGIHGAGGIVGAILTGVFQSQHVNNDVSNGLIYTGDVHSVLIQILAVIVVLCYTIVLTWIIGKILQKIMPIATTEEEDKAGLDQLVHGEKAYFYGELNKLNKRY